MPWWVWLILALFMVAMLVAGVVYVVLHALRDVHQMSDVGERIGRRLAQMGEQPQHADTSSAPFFTRPVCDATQRYADAHAGVIARREMKRSRHVAVWARWSRTSLAQQTDGKDSTRL